jgi:hypothetical protein
MTKTMLQGPFPLAFDEIATVADEAPGVFALGYIDMNGAFRINAVGRADDSLAATLRALIGSDQAFKFAPAVDARAAFERECELFHDFRPPSTRIHPSRPAGTDFTCPRCAHGGMS